MAQPPNSPPSSKPKSPNPGIFATIKNLTSSKRPTAASSSSASTPATDRSPLVDSAAFSKDQSKKSCATAPTGQLDSNSHDIGAPKPQDAYVAAPSDHVAELIDSLGSSNSTQDRINACHSLSKYLNEYPALYIRGMWQRAKDLVQTADDQPAFSAGCSLLIACARHPNLEPIEKPLLFDSITHDSFLAYPAQCLAALNAITRDAKDFEAIDLARLSTLLVTLLDKSYVLADAARKRARSDKSSSSPANNDSHLVAVFQFILHTVKFSSFKSFDETYLDIIIEHILGVCRRTRAESDLAHSLEILEAVLIYSIFPKSCLHPCVEVLCGIFSSVESLKPQSLQLVLQKMLHSYLSADTLSTLQTMLRDSADRPLKERNSNAVRGAVQIFREIIASHEIISAADLPCLLSALGRSLQLNSARLELDTINLILELFRREDLAQPLVLDDTAWTELSGVIMHLSTGVNVPDPELSSASARSERAPALDKDNFLYPKFIDGFQQISDHLISFCESVDVDRKFPIMRLLLDVINCLSDSQVVSIVDLYVGERLIFPSHEHWLGTCHAIVSALLRERSKSPAIQLKTLEALFNAHSIAAASQFPEAQELAMAILDSLKHISDIQIVNALADFAANVAIGTDNLQNFIPVVELLQSLLFQAHGGVKSPSRSTSAHERLGAFEVDSAVQFSRTSEAVIAKALVTIFLRSINTSAEKSQTLFGVLLAVARSQEVATEARIISLKLLSRLRSDVNFAIFVAVETESEGLAAALCRTAETATAQEVPERQPAPTPKRESSISRRKPQAISTSSMSAALGSARSVSSTGRINRPTPPMWMYPGPRGLPEDPPRQSSHLVFSHERPVHVSAEASHYQIAKPVILKIGLWLELVLDILQREELEWETYSYIIVHIGPQLGNHSLFIDAIPQIKLLRNVLCDLLQNKKFAEPPSFTNLKKPDVANCLYHVLNMLISFHNHFAKSEADEIVKSFVFGIGSWDRTSEVCIHALSVCCHEIPMSFVKYLEVALQRMIQIIAQSSIAVHILEFLAGLARLPSLFRNFREEEFKSVFGICFRYLQYVRDQRGKHGGTAASSKSPPTVRQYKDMDSPNITPSLAEVLPQYVYAMAYHVMIFWFIALKLQDRARHLAWIRSNLVYTNDKGQEELEEQSQVTIDLMHRVAYSDRDETIPDDLFAKPADGPVLSKSFLVGFSILTVETAGWSGVSHITIRRPSGTKYTVSRPHVSALPRHQAPILVGAAEDPTYPTDYVGVTPDDVVQNLYSPMSISPSLASLTDGPIPLPEDDATKRSISSFDRIPALDGHKVGIIYIGENQSSEAIILANVMGSSDYVSFLNGIGTLTELQGANFNTQGLDREYGTDGKFTYCWRDRVSELVFHVPTMMPTDLERDPQCSQKKKHIGNDYVNIIFNNSGSPFDFDTFPSDFNFVNIVITPEARSSFVDTRLRANKRQQMRNTAGSSESLEKLSRDFADNDIFYQITVMTKPGLPKFSPASETKVVSGKSLPSFVRLLALNASVFAQVWANREGGEHVSSWRSRLREIVRLRERNQSAKEAKTNENTSGGTGSSNPYLQSPSLTAQSPGNERISGRESGLLRRASAATFFSEAGANRNSGVGAAAEAEGRTRSSTASHE